MKVSLKREKRENIIRRKETRQDNLELEKLRIEAQIGSNQEILSRNNRTPSNELNKLLPKFDMKEDISLYLILFERQACMMNVPKEFWISHLLGLLPQEIPQLITREPEQGVSTKIVDHSKLSRINTVLYGLGQTEVITKGSFEYDFVLDKDQYSLTWHMLPNKQLNFEAIVGTDILGQASLNFSKEGVMLHKHEEKACLMQISRVHPEDELDFSHILDSQVKKDLTRITSSYKPEKTESTYMTRRIILNDDIPIYQPARRLSYAEKKSVNKHIEEWLE
ncbi:transposon Ty3-I Gag-Pol polyprotein [Trichonephila clavipes]|nr:transposon Ty3-I Gag-Pol polyprotein [Trichonephila clavipes]